VPEAALGTDRRSRGRTACPALAGLRADDAVHPLAIELLGDEGEAELLSHGAGEEPPQRVLLPPRLLDDCRDRRSPGPLSLSMPRKRRGKGQGSRRRAQRRSLFARGSALPDSNQYREQEAGHRARGGRDARHVPAFPDAARSEASRRNSSAETSYRKSAPSRAAAPRVVVRTSVGALAHFLKKRFHGERVRDKIAADDLPLELGNHKSALRVRRLLLLVVLKDCVTRHERDGMMVDEPRQPPTRRTIGLNGGWPLTPRAPRKLLRCAMAQAHRS
jgi:hypothetical protein